MHEVLSPTFATVLGVSPQRAIGMVLVGVLIVGTLVYWFFNWIQGREEIGAELELAPNRKPQWGDELMETKRLDMSLTAALGMLGIIAISLPLYWLGEPGRHEGAIEYKEDQFVRAGEGLYEENCGQCHGSVEGGGGLRSFTILDDSGNFVDQVDWQVPSLAGLMQRYSFEEVRYILNFGRQNSPMPAWGAPGGGPLTEQHLENIIEYIADEQLTQDELADTVVAGLEAAAEDVALTRNPDVAVEIARQDHHIADLEHDVEDAELVLRKANKVKFDGDAEAAAAVEADATVAAAKAALKAAQEELDAYQTGVLGPLASPILAEAQADPTGATMGELLFNNPAGAGAYGCARCHSAGWSYSANDIASADLADGATMDQLLIPHVVDGGGGFGPALNGGATLSQFSDDDEQIDFITVGSVNGQKYGNYGQGDGGGQMPAFGVCVADRDSGERAPIFGHCEGRSGTLSTDQIAAIVAYERGLE